jgi:hypothetical protein
VIKVMSYEDKQRHSLLSGKGGVYRDLRVLRKGFLGRVRLVVYCAGC